VRAARAVARRPRRRERRLGRDRDQPEINPKTGDVGVGFGEQTKNDAQNEAEKDCKGKCRQVLYVRNKCGAVAVNSRRLVAGFGPTKHDAVKKAKKKARKGPGGAKLVAWVCSG
jgi:hypothetical protein